MKVAFAKSFDKQLSDIKDKKLLNEISKCIQEVMHANSLV